METITNRISLIVNYLDTPMRVFEQDINVGHSTIRNAIANNKTVGSDVLYKILYRYPEISAEWLMRGEGSMLLNNDAKHLINGTNKGVNGNINGGEISIQNIEHNTLVEEVTFLRGQITEKDKQISFFQSMLEKFNPQKP